MPVEQKIAVEGGSAEYHASLFLPEIDEACGIPDLK